MCNKTVENNVKLIAVIHMVFKNMSVNKDMDLRIVDGKLVMSDFPKHTTISFTVGWGNRINMRVMAHDPDDLDDVPYQTKLDDAGMNDITEIEAFIKTHFNL